MSIQFTIVTDILKEQERELLNYIRADHPEDESLVIILMPFLRLGQ